MIGQRLPDGEPSPWPPPIGAYWRMQKRVDSNELVFYAMTPNGLYANLAGHNVIEHDDGTITVTPSILCRQPSVGEWHGFLERGVWRSC
jgi:hypothetical protein